MRGILLVSVALFAVSCAGDGNGSGDTSLGTQDISVDGASAQDTTGASDATSPGDTHNPTNDTVTSPDAENGVDTGTPVDPPTGAGNVGDACSADTDCLGTGAVCLDLPGGYCSIKTCGTNPCPAGAGCYEFQDGDTYCIKQCAAGSECRESEGYVCDTDNTCWPGGEQPAPTGDSPIGGPCSADADCKDPGATCYPETSQGSPTGFVNGYCMLWGCEPGSCPTGATCLTITQDGQAACFAACTTASDCPQTLGYACSAESNTCWPGCNGDAECPPGYGCHPEVKGCVAGWSNEPFDCDDQSFEPNDSVNASADLSVPLSQSGVDLCSGDLDWYKVTFPKGTIGTVGATFNHVQGDLDVLAYDASATFLGNRLWQGGPENYGANYRGNESDYEYLSVMNQDEPVSAYFKVQGFSAAQNAYTLNVTQTEYQDGALCTSKYSEAECAGYTGAQAGNLHQFPFAQAADPYVPDGYMFDSYGSYRYLRRELIMLVRHAIHEVQAQFPGTKPLGLIDMCDREGITPGFDVGSPRHPESTHDQGGNIDIAYYQTDASSSAESVCGANNSDNDGYFCTSVANHIMDIPRTALFMTILANHPRIRVIGIDTLLAPLVQAGAADLKNQGVITAAQYNKLVAFMAYGEGWPFHHHHMHVSMKWWSQGVGNGYFVPKESPVGCGYRMPGDGPLPMLKLGNVTP